MTYQSAPLDASERPQPRRKLAVLAGLLVAVLVLVGGAVFYTQRPAEFRATSTLVVLPNGESAELASYYDTLSSGQVATTLAQILSLRAEPVDGEDASISVDLVPDTSLIQVIATSPDAATAESAANTALEQVQPYFATLRWPYQVSVVRDATGTSESTGLGGPLLAAVVIPLALIAGLATFLAVRAIQRPGEMARATRAARDAGAATGGRSPADVADDGRRSSTGQASAVANGHAPSAAQHLATTGQRAAGDRETLGDSAGAGVRAEGAHRSEDDMAPDVPTSSAPHPVTSPPVR